MKMTTPLLLRYMKRCRYPHPLILIHITFLMPEASDDIATRAPNHGFCRHAMLPLLPLIIAITPAPLRHAASAAARLPRHFTIIIIFIITPLRQRH